MDEQGVFIHCTHKSRMAGGRWLGGLYDTYPMPGLLITWQRVILSSEDENLYNSDAFTSQIEKLKTLLNENRTKYADQTDISIMPEEWRKIYRGPEARKE